MYLYFTKASVHDDGSRHWAATVSDTSPDNHDERVDKAFFKDAIEKAKVRGMPHLCISHYDFSGKGVPEDIWKAGFTTAMFVDGEKFKAKGQFLNNKAGNALFSCIRRDMEDSVPHDERARISMGFFDETAEGQKSEAVGDNGESRRVYKSGWIKHFAGTRVPVLPRTEIEAWKEMSMTTKKQDASSIAGEELAEELDKWQQEVGKSETEELIVKGEEVEKAKRKKVNKDFEYEKEEPGKETMAEEMWTETPEEAEVPGLDQAAKRANEEELEKKKKKKKSETEVEKARGEGQGMGGPKQGDGGPAECTCPECGATAPHEAGVPCTSVTCPKCGAKMSGVEKAELVEKMIKKEGSKIVLYSKDGSKKLGEWEFGPGKKYSDEKAARAAAHKREGQIQFFKHQKSETEEDSSDEVPIESSDDSEDLEEQSELVEMKEKDPYGGSFSAMWKQKYGGSVRKCVQMVGDKVGDAGAYCAWMKDKALKSKEWRKGPRKKSETEEMTEDNVIQLWEEEVEQSETVEKAGRKVSDARLKAFEDMQRRLSELGGMVTSLNEAMETWYNDAQYTPEAIVNTSTEAQPLPENPAIAVLEGGAPVMAADFDDSMTKFAEEVYNAVTEGSPEVAQDALNYIAEAIKSEIDTSMAEVGGSEAEPEVSVKAEEVQQSATTPLDVFNIKVKSVLESEELDRRGKLQACQEALGDVGGWIQQNVIQETPPSMGDIREVIVAAVNEGTRPLVQENAALKAELEEVKRQVQNKPVVEEVPIRKSMYRTQGPPAEPKESFSAKEVARMTTPPGMFY